MGEPPSQFHQPWIWGNWPRLMNTPARQKWHFLDSPSLASGSDSWSLECARHWPLRMSLHLGRLPPALEVGILRKLLPV